jgi:hypothetical protein
VRRVLNGIGKTSENPPIVRSNSLSFPAQRVRLRVADASCLSATRASRLERHVFGEAS